MTKKRISPLLEREPSSDRNLDRIMNRLIRRDYHLLNEGSLWGRRFWHFELYPFGYSQTDSCNLIVTVSESDPQRHEAHFRLRFNSDIHVTRYLVLGRRDGWKRLEEFEKLYHKMSMEKAADVTDAIASHQEKAKPRKKRLTSKRKEETKIHLENLDREFEKRWESAAHR